MSEHGYRVVSDGILSVAELQDAEPALAVAALDHALASYGQVGIALVVSLQGTSFVPAGVNSALVRWAQASQTRRGLALVVPARWVLSMRAISADIATLGGLVGVFSEATAAKSYALREGSIWWVDEGRALALQAPRIGQVCSPSAHKQYADAQGLAAHQAAIRG